MSGKGVEVKPGACGIECFSMPNISARYNTLVGSSQNHQDQLFKTHNSVQMKVIATNRQTKNRQKGNTILFWLHHHTRCERILPMCVVEQNKHSKESQGFLEEIAQRHECGRTHMGGFVGSFYPILYSEAGTVSCTSY